MSAHLHALIPKLADQTILVVGDVILDEYLIGQATRMSREAPIPVLEFESQQFIPGGATNPSANIVKLGSRAMQIGVIGEDNNAENLKRTLIERGIDVSGLIADTNRPTTVKTRVLAQMGLRFPQQVARLDRLSRKDINADIALRLTVDITQRSPQAQAILLSDYHVGLLTPSLIEHIRQKASERQLIWTADAQGALEKYRGATLVKCNADDASDYLQRSLNTDADYAQAGIDLYKQLELTGGMVITRGAKGATLAINASEVVHCPSPFVTDVYDTVGAGDTSIAVMTLAISAGANYADAVMLANYASGLVVRRVGNYAPTPDELGWALNEWHI